MTASSARQTTAARLHIMVAGLRGFPDVQGGVEIHAQNLCRRLVARGCDVLVAVRGAYQPVAYRATWQGVRFVPVPHVRGASAETFGHTLLAVLLAGLRRPDVLHLHAIGPAIMTPLARLLGLRVVVTHHGRDYEREKWGRVARFVLRRGEAWGMRHATRSIAISHDIADAVRRDYGVTCTVIPNGVDLPGAPGSTGALDQFGLTPGRYMICVGRLVAEKRQADLIEAFAGLAPAGWRLALVGGADHEASYSRRLREAAAAAPNVVLTGVQRGVALQALLANAGLFVLPSSHEGLPIALLEAISHALPVIASDIPANREVALPEGCYYPVGDIAALTGRLAAAIATPEPAEVREQRRARICAMYDWERVTEATLAVYRAAVGP